MGISLGIQNNLTKFGMGFFGVLLEVLGIFGGFDF